MRADWRWAMELPGHADSFHDDVWPQELGRRWGGWGGGSAISCAGSTSRGAGRVWSLGLSTL